MKLQRKLYYFLFSVLSLLLSTSQIALAADSIAIDGYDAVAYFTSQKATRGTQELTYQWNGKTWQFSSLKHKELFAANPDKYAPQFNGFCANGLSDGHAIEGNPENWRVIDGKLYLYFSDYGRDQWSGNVKSLLQDAEKTFKTH
jgi:YHS domain-containing protein